MRAPVVAALVVLAVLVVAGGWYFGTATAPPERTTIASGGLMFPELATQLRDATKVEITHQDKVTVIEKRPGGGWGVVSLHDYPVQETKLRGLLTGLTELRLAEARTSDPAEFARLGVDDPKSKGSTGDLLRVLDASGKPLVALIIGHRRVRGQANVPDEVYVRRPEENQSWLAEGSLPLEADATQWLDRDVLNIAHDRIASVTAARVEEGGGAGQPLVFAQVDGKFSLTQPTDHPKLEDYKVDDVARALEQLTFQAVQADADVTGSEVGHSVFTTKEGLAVNVTVLHVDKDAWARFTVSSSDDKAKAEAERLGGRLAGWTYQIGSWKERSLLPTIDDLKAAEPTRPAVQAMPVAPPGSMAPPALGEPTTPAPAEAQTAPGAAAPEADHAADADKK
jgi:Domain of unknown function (DUF4340)